MPRSVLLAALLLLPAAVASAQDGGQMSGQVVAIGQQGRLALNLTLDHVRGGERAQIVRQTTTGQWVRAAVGDIAEVTPAGSVLIVTRYEPNMGAAVIGDYVVVALHPPGAAAGFTGAAGGAAVPTAPAEPEALAGAGAQAAEATAELPGDWLAVGFGVKYFAAFAGKSEPEEAPPEESGKAGFGWAIGPALTVRAAKYFELETGLSYYKNGLGKKTTIYPPGGGVCQVEQTVESDALRLPAIARLLLPLQFEDGVGMRLSVGLGAEWAFGKKSALKLSEGGCTVVGVGGVAPADQRFLVVDLGVALTVHDVIVSLNFRGDYNGDNSPKFEDYFLGRTETMEHTVDAGVLLGVLYEYDAL